MIIKFHHGPLSDDYETQANRQGFTFGEYAEFVNTVGFGISAARMYKVITNSEYKKILARFYKKILFNKEFLKKLEGREKGMTKAEMIEQIENTILLIKQNGKDWWDERDIPILEEAIKAMKNDEKR